MKDVLVTGANGHLGYNIARLLSEKGYRVRASVRDATDRSKTDHLRAIGVDVVEADLMRPDTLRRAMEGVDGLFHVAAVYNLTSKNPEKEVREPILQGSLNALRAAKEAGTKKVIYTSSVAAVGTVAAGEAPLTEKDWNDRAIEPYARAKMEAERQAWELARETGLNLVTILPGSIVGPGFHRHTPTTVAFELLLRGKVPVVLPLAFTFVDVRDVARAHLLAYENPASSGRYIASDRDCSMAELFAMVAEIDPTVPVPKARLSERLLPLVPVLDWLGNRLAGTPRFASRAMIREYGRRLQLVSSDRIRTELGWKPRDLKASIRDTLEWTRLRFIDTHRDQDGAVEAVRTR